MNFYKKIVYSIGMLMLSIVAYYGILKGIEICFYVKVVEYFPMLDIGYKAKILIASALILIFFLHQQEKLKVKIVIDSFVIVFFISGFLWLFNYQFQEDSSRLAVSKVQESSKSLEEKDVEVLFGKLTNMEDDDFVKACQLIIYSNDFYISFNRVSFILECMIKRTQNEQIVEKLNKLFFEMVRIDFDLANKSIQSVFNLLYTDDGNDYKENYFFDTELPSEEQQKKYKTWYVLNRVSNNRFLITKSIYCEGAKAK